MMFTDGPVVSTPPPPNDNRRAVLFFAGGSQLEWTIGAENPQPGRSTSAIPGIN